MVVNVSITYIPIIVISHLNVDMSYHVFINSLALYNVALSEDTKKVERMS